VPVDVKPLLDRLGDDRPDAFDGGQLLGAGGPERLHRAELGGQGAGGGRSNVPDRQGHEHPPQRLGLGLLEVADQLPPLARSHPGWTGATPATAASASVLAARIASTEPSSVARARAAVGRTCRIDRATSTRHSGWALACWRLSTSFCPLAESTRPSTTASCGSVFFAARVKSGTRATSSAVSENSVASLVSTPASSRAFTPAAPSASMSNAPRLAME